MNKSALTLASLFASLGAFATAGTETSSSAKETTPTPSLYNANEWQLDLSGIYSFSVDRDRRLIRDHAWGGDLAANYFFTRNLGLGVEGSLFDDRGTTLGSAALNVYERLPIGNSPVAIYAFEGAGFTFNADRLDFRRWDGRVDHSVFEGHAGLGAEYRFTPNLGLFTDVRYTFENSRDSNYATARAGLRIAF